MGRLVGIARTAPTGYGTVTKVLHWSTVVALAAQFAVGYALDVGGGRGRGRGRGRSGESGRGRGRGRGGDDDLLSTIGDDALLTTHVALGVAILLLTAVRLSWRRRTGLPPWAGGLAGWERTLAHWTERALYTVLVVMPLTGLALVLVSDDLVALHVASHLAFFVVVAVHVGQVLRHQLLLRDGLLRRML